jgi:hypothetical protein
MIEVIYTSYIKDFVKAINDAQKDGKIIHYESYQIASDETKNWFSIIVESGEKNVD